MNEYTLTTSPDSLADDGSPSERHRPSKPNDVGSSPTPGSTPTYSVFACSVCGKPKPCPWVILSQPMCECPTDGAGAAQELARDATALRADAGTEGR